MFTLDINTSYNYQSLNYIYKKKTDLQNR